MGIDLHHNSRDHPNAFVVLFNLWPYTTDEIRGVKTESHTMIALIFWFIMFLYCLGAVITSFAISNLYEQGKLPEDNKVFHMLITPWLWPLLLLILDDN